jgi:hypothetical protein
MIKTFLASKTPISKRFHICVPAPRRNQELVNPRYEGHDSQAVARGRGGDVGEGENTAVEASNVTPGVGGEGEKRE